MGVDLESPNKTISACIAPKLVLKLIHCISGCGAIIRIGGARMRAIFLLCVMLFAASLLCSATDQTAASENPWLVVPSGRTGYAFNQLDNDNGVSAKLLRRRANLQRRPDNDYCLMLRTYIVVRENRDSDVTRRDGEIICQPAWKFDIRTAVGRISGDR